MDRFGKIVAGLGLFFLAFAMLIGSETAAANLLFLALLYVTRDRLKQGLAKLSGNKAVQLVAFGTLLGITLEALWYFGHAFEGKPQQWASFLDDVIRMLPVYLLLFIFVQWTIKRYPFTGKEAFAYGGAMGYIFYFIMEGMEAGFPPLLIVWELNNLFLNGVLIWLPLYATNNLEGHESRTPAGHLWICALLLGGVIVSIAASLLLQAAFGYVPVRIGP